MFKNQFGRITTGKCNTAGVLKRMVMQHSFVNDDDDDGGDGDGGAGGNVSEVVMVIMMVMVVRW